jgi:hypothetical protein
MYVVAGMPVRLPEWYNIEATPSSYSIVMLDRALCASAYATVEQPMRTCCSRCRAPRRSQSAVGDGGATWRVQHPSSPARASFSGRPQHRWRKGRRKPGCESERVQAGSHWGNVETRGGVSPQDGARGAGGPQDAPGQSPGDLPPSG